MIVKSRKNVTTRVRVTTLNRSNEYEEYEQPSLTTVWSLWWTSVCSESDIWEEPTPAVSQMSYRPGKPPPPASKQLDHVLSRPLWAWQISPWLQTRVRWELQTAAPHTGRAWLASLKAWFSLKSGCWSECGAKDFHNHLPHNETRSRWTLHSNFAYTALYCFIAEVMRWSCLSFFMGTQIENPII